MSEKNGLWHKASALLGQGRIRGTGSEESALVTTATDAPDTVRAQMVMLLKNRSRLLEMQSVESAAARGFRRRFDEVDALRIEAMTEARILDDSNAQRYAQAMQDETHALQRKAEDCEAISRGIGAKIACVEEEINGLRTRYQQELGAFLDGIFARTAAHYREIAPGLADLVLEMAAIKQVMLTHLAGNSNGFDHLSAVIPRAEPGNGRTLPVYCDGDSREFEALVRERAQKMNHELQAAGFSCRPF